MIEDEFGGRVAHALLDALENPKHSHSHWVPRPWWKWRLAYDPEGLSVIGGEFPRFYVIKGDTVEVPCNGTLTPRSKPKMKKERTDLCTKLVASRQYECDAPVVGDRRDVLLYAAARLEG